MPSFPLADILRERGLEIASGGLEALDDSLDACHRRAAAAWPGVELDAPTFVRRIAALWDSQTPFDTWLAALQTEHIYLACACAAGGRTALAAFETSFMSVVPRDLARLGVDPQLREDLCQMLREKLFASAPGTAPKIAEYSGRGPLASWLRVLAARMLTDVRRKRTERVADESGDAAITDDSDPEMTIIKRRYWPVFIDALREALTAVDLEQRELLRLHFVAGHTLEELARSRGLGRATIVRRLAAARGAVLTHARRIVQHRLAIRPNELDSLFRLVRSQLRVSLSGSFA
jgi:RNA polymerase sigma-70 factor (ECF subfamily)